MDQTSVQEATTPPGAAEPDPAGHGPADGDAARFNAPGMGLVSLGIIAIVVAACAFLLFALPNVAVHPLVLGAFALTIAVTVFMSYGLWRHFGGRGDTLTIDARGVRDTRLGDATIPWAAVSRIGGRRNIGGTWNFFLTVDPARVEGRTSWLVPKLSPRHPADPPGLKTFTVTSIYLKGNPADEVRAALERFSGMRVELPAEDESRTGHLLLTLSVACAALFAAVHFLAPEEKYLRYAALAGAIVFLFIFALRHDRRR